MLAKASWLLLIGRTCIESRRRIITDKNVDEDDLDTGQRAKDHLQRRRGRALCVAFMTSISCHVRRRLGGQVHKPAI